MLLRAPVLTPLLFCIDGTYINNDASEYGGECSAATGSRPIYSQIRNSLLGAYDPQVGLSSSFATRELQTLSIFNTPGRQDGTAPIVAE
jgi:hypothetical protein